MDWSLRPASQRRKVVALVSKFDHCLGHLLYASRIGGIDMDVVAIISNHPKEALTIKSWLEDVPYHYFPTTKDTKAQQEALLQAHLAETVDQPLILERYLHILSMALPAITT